MLQRIFRANN